MQYKFTLARDRSIASSKYEFEFIGNSRLAIVPVLQRYQKGYRLLGTGSYFIRPNIFITAAHLFDGSDIAANDSFYILSERSLDLDYPYEIIEVRMHEIFDLAFLTIDQEGEKFFNGINPLAVMNLPPERHEIVGVFGFSHSIVDSNDVVENKEVVCQNMQIRSKWEVGGVLKVHSSGRGMVKGQCFETSVLAEGRDSGAPMFNSNGFLVGLLSTSLDFASGLPNSVCTSILELADIPINGIPIKKLWSKKPRAAFCSVK